MAKRVEEMGTAARWWLIWLIQNDAKKLKKTYGSIWVLIYKYSVRVLVLVGMNTYQHMTGLK